MSKLILISLFGFSFMQDIDKQGWSNEAKATYYLAEKISPEKALMLQFQIPVPFANLGYAYSDNWKKGLNLDLILTSSLFIASQTYKKKDDKLEDCEYWDNYCDRNYKSYDNLGDLFTLLSLGTIIFKSIDVYNSAETYNDNLYRRVFGFERGYFSTNYNKQNNEVLLAFNFPIKSSF